MKITIRKDLGGYAMDVVRNAGVDGTVLNRPFTLITGPNGSGKSALMRGIRATIGLRGERAGQLEVEFGNRPIDVASARGDVERLNTHVSSFQGEGAAEYVPVVLDLKDLGWKGQLTYLFDSRAASTMASKGSFDDDIGYHVSLIAGGGKNASHGQFVGRTWQEALNWAAGLQNVGGGWTVGSRMPARRALADAALGGEDPSTERWLFIDEPETAIDAEALFLGLSALLKLAEIGKLRVFCASHSLLFAAGLMQHPKIQILDLGPQASWLKTQEIVLGLARDQDKVATIGRDIVDRMTSRSKVQPDKPKRPATPGSRRRKTTTKTDA